MEKSIKLTPIEFIHWLTFYPILKDRLLLATDPDSVGPKLWSGGLVPEFLDKLSTQERKYFIYCLNAYQVESRDYNLLRSFLEWNIHQFAGHLYEILFQMFADAHYLGDECNITQIYDLGAGHLAWSTILKKIFPFAEITLVDKRHLPECIGFNIEQKDVLDWLQEFKGWGSHTLIFMSEFLHCKKSHMSLLEKYREGFSKSHLLINEVEPTEKFIDFRLRLTNGGLFLPEEIDKVFHLDKVLRYNNTFDYWISYKGPLRD